MKHNREGDSPRDARGSDGQDEELLDLLRGAGYDVAGPARELTDAERQRTDSAADAALARILASPRDPSPAQLPAGPAVGSRLVDRLRDLIPGGRWTVVAAGAVACSVLLAVVFALRPAQQPMSPEKPPPPVANGLTPPMANFSLVAQYGRLEGQPAGPALRALAVAASEQPPPADKPIHHTRLDGWFLTQDSPTHSSLVPTVTDGYFLTGGKFRRTEARGVPLDGYGRVTDRVPVGPVTVDETFSTSKLKIDYADNLPTNPTELRRVLVPTGTCTLMAECLATEITSLHYTWVLRPGLTAALWMALASEPEVSLLGETSDRLGRKALGFSIPTANQNLRIILYADPTTGALLGSEDVRLAHEPGDKIPATVKPPIVVGFTALAVSNRISEEDLPPPA